MADRKRPSTIAQAKADKRKTFYGKGNKELAAVTKEELEESGLSLRDYLNKQQGKTRRTAAKVAPISKPKPAPKASAPSSSAASAKRKAEKGAENLEKIAAFLEEKKRREEAKTGADLSTPKSKARPAPASKKSKVSPVAAKKPAPKESASQRPDNRPARRGSSAPLGGKADPFKYVGKGKRGKPGQAPVPTTEEKVAMAGLALSALGGPGTIAGKAAIKGATKFGKPFITNLIKKIKDLAPKQQKEVLKAVNKGKTKTEAEKLGQDSMKVFKGGKSSAKDRVEPYITKASKPLTKGQSSASRTMAAARQSQRIEIDPSYTGGALKRGGQIKKYNKGGKVVKRKEGGQVISGSDLVSSLYD